MRTREEFITSMCYTWRHDYGLDRRDSDLLAAGMTPEERMFLWQQMALIFDNDIAPYVKVKRARKDKTVQTELGYSRVGWNAMRRGR